MPCASLAARAKADDAICVQGFGTAKTLNEQPTDGDAPKNKCTIADCGQLPEGAPLTVLEPDQVSSFVSLESMLHDELQQYLLCSPSAQSSRRSVSCSGSKLSLPCRLQAAEPMAAERNEHVHVHMLKFLLSSACCCRTPLTPSPRTLRTQTCPRAPRWWPSACRPQRSSERLAMPSSSRCTAHRSCYANLVVWAHAACLSSCTRAMGPLQITVRAAGCSL